MCDISILFVVIGNNSLMLNSSFNLVDRTIALAHTLRAMYPRWYDSDF